MRRWTFLVLAVAAAVAAMASSIAYFAGGDEGGADARPSAETRPLTVEQPTASAAPSKPQAAPERPSAERPPPARPFGPPDRPERCLDQQAPQEVRGSKPVEPGEQQVEPIPPWPSECYPRPEGEPWPSDEPVRVQPLPS